jgi:hypothetical protein
MTTDKKKEGPDPDALEFQIEKMIDELFVNKDEGGLPQILPPGILGEASPPQAASVSQKPGEAAASSGQDFKLGQEEKKGSVQKEKVSEIEDQFVFNPTPETRPLETGPSLTPSDSTFGEGKFVSQLQDPVISHSERDDFFPGLGGSLRTAPTAFQEPSEPSVYPITRDPVAQQLYDSLKESILSLEWEISSQNINRFLEVMPPLQAHLSENATAVKTAMMMNSVLNYIKKIGRSALPLSIQVLQSAVDFLGTVLLPDSNVTGENRRELQATVVDQYKLLKFQIEQQKEKTPRAKPRVSEVPQPVSPELAGYIKNAVQEAVRGMLDKVLQEELHKFKQQVLEMMPKATQPMATSSASPELQPTTEAQVLTVTFGDQRYNVPKSLVANIYAPSQGKIGKILRSGSFGIKDLVSLFGSITKGLTGPLAAVPMNELKNQTFNLVDTAQSFKTQGALQARQLVLISNGKSGYGFLADATQWRTVEIPSGFIEGMTQKDDSAAESLQASPKEYPFLNVARLL